MADARRARRTQQGIKRGTPGGGGGRTREEHRVTTGKGRVKRGRIVQIEARGFARRVRRRCLARSAPAGHAAIRTTATPMRSEAPVTNNIGFPFL